ncbi:MAG: Sorting nexin mvp1 [Piccolia ochrophora]|nr:MAG: Sorting nexin mvp1 [Piccolia ochrophora]
MSLFGTPPNESPLAKASSGTGASLFDDSTPAATVPSSSLFSEEANGPSPWDMPTPKKASRGDLVNSLLSDSDTPESYVDAFDALLGLEGNDGSALSVASVKRILSNSGSGSANQQKILEIVVPGGKDNAGTISRGAFNVLLALIGLAQEGEDISLDGIDDRRKNLPEPNIALVESLKASKQSTHAEEAAGPTQQAEIPSRGQNLDGTPSRPSQNPKASVDVPDSDPWASSEMHKGHDHSQSSNVVPRMNGNTSKRGMFGGSDAGGRTTSTFTTTSAEPSLDSSRDVAPPRNNTDSGAAGWDSYDTPNREAYASHPDLGIGNEAFGGSGEGDEGPNNDPNRLSRSLGGGRVTGTGVEEVVTVTLLPEKEGMFMFQHRNYQVSSVRRGSKVVRRYSDFVWLLDCLHKRYPFRQLPLLPPKRVAVNGNHLLSDASFVEKRRRGLARFTNALVRHPVLNQEQLVIMFLTVPTELAVWRKQAQISVQEEFTGKPLPPTLEDSLPPTLEDTFDTVRSGIRRSSELYINLCGLLERLTKRNEGVAADCLRLSLALQALTDASEDTYAVDTNDVPLLNAGLNATAKHLSASQGLLEDEAKAWDEGAVEDMKRQRDVLVSARDMFERRDRYAKDNIPTLEKRIQNNEAKLTGLKGRPDGTVKPEEIEKVEVAIIKDKESIVAQHARGVFIKECIRDELNFFQQSQYHVSRLHQDWSQERVKYAELQADNWRSLSEEVEGMPLGE